MCVVRNVTTQKRMVSDLITSQKLASLGSLAAGVAHEMNSPLQVIIGLSSSLEERINRTNTTRLASDKIYRPSIATAGAPQKSFAPFSSTPVLLSKKCSQSI